MNKRMRRKAKASFLNFLFITDVVANALSSRAPPDLAKITSVIGWRATRASTKSTITDHLGLKFKYS